MHKAERPMPANTPELAPGYFWRVVVPASVIMSMAFESALGLTKEITLSDYEYQAQYRYLMNNGSETEWSNIHTTRNRHGVYKTLGAARAIITSEKKEFERRCRYLDKVMSCEYRIRRRSIGEWEEF